MKPLDQTGATRDFFERRAVEWSDQYAPNGGMSDRVQRFLGPLRERVGTGMPILDLGCGTGEIARAAQSWTVTAADLSPSMLAEARRQPSAANIAWIPLDGKRLPFADRQFVAVLSSSVLEYIEDLPNHLAEVARVLDEGGWYFATVPDPRHPIRQAERRKQRLARCEPIFGLVRHTRWRSDFEYLRLSINRFALEEWQAQLARVGLAVDDIGANSHPLFLIAAQKR
jgi:ubiquinone/menaquinone biosynthesis C-methylase UbiE